MSRNINFRFDDEYLETYFRKRNEFNILKHEVEEMSAKIKAALNKNGMIYTSTEHYAVTLNQIYKTNSNFILLLKNSNLESYISETCTMKNFHLLTSELCLKDIDNYIDLSHHVLKVSKKN